MDFEFSKDQKLIRQSAKEFFEKECPKERTRELMADKKGYDPKMWKKMAQLGFVGLIIPEEYGGTEGQFIELAIFMEEMGRNIVPGPFSTTVCLCAPAIQEFGSNAQKRNILPGIAEKGDIWSLALNEKRTDYEAADIQLMAAGQGDGFVLNGTKLFAPYANAAKHLLVPARTATKTAAEDGITGTLEAAGAASPPSIPHVPDVDLDQLGLAYARGADEFANELNKSAESADPVESSEVNACLDASGDAAGDASISIVATATIEGVDVVVLSVTPTTGDPYLVALDVTTCRELASTRP